MNSPTRLLESCSNSEARELLRAGMAERPKRSARRATALALGLSAGVTVASAAGAAGASLSAGSVVAVPSLGLVAAKWLVVGTLTGLLLAAGATALRPAAPRANSLSAPIAAAPRAAASPPARALSTPSEATVPAEQASARSEPAAPKPARAARDPGVAPSAASPALPTSAALPNGRDLGQEVAKIDAARRAISAGNPAAALRQLDDYAALDRTSTLDREAQLLRVDALVLAGRRADAVALARAYLQKYPADPHSARLQGLVANQ